MLVLHASVIPNRLLDASNQVLKGVDGSNGISPIEYQRNEDVYEEECNGQGIAGRGTEQDDDDIGGRLGVGESEIQIRIRIQSREGCHIVW